nr:MAG: E1 protein [Neophocaena asiaeorientalis asiaeorientalis papillomavirus 4]
MDTNQGTDPLEGGSGDWVILEAEDAGDCGGDDDEDDYDTGEDMVDFIDDSLQQDVAELSSLSMHVEHEKAADERALQALKRKFVGSPKTKLDLGIGTLSPRLAAISLQERTGKARRRLYEGDSGNGDSLEEACGEAMVVAGTQVLAKNSYGREGETPMVVLEKEASQPGEDCTLLVTQMLRSGKSRPCLLGIFKDVFGCSLTDLTRPFKSDKTSCEDWVALIVGAPCSLAEAIPELLKAHCMYSHVTCTTCKLGIMVLILVRWKSAKNRDTIRKLFAGLLSVQNEQMVLDPPRIRHPGAAMFWYKKAMANGTSVSGEPPEWITKQVSIQGNMGEACQFSLAVMVQWAYDNGVDNEAQAAYDYALLAEEDTNAEAFLRSNQQAKYVRDCITMVKHYRKAEMQKMTMGQWIKRQAEKVEGDGDWKPIVKFLKFQNVELLTFLTFFRKFLQGTPKKNCMVISGPPNAGKSLFGMSLMAFLGGKVISHVNSKSHFWLQPLGECKVGMLDDATVDTWNYIDIYLRNLLDGTPISLDCKHKALVQIKSPPLVITTNVDITNNDRWKYLQSRVTVFPFMNECPLDEQGNPVFKLTKENWKCFFLRCWSRLTLDDAVVSGDDGDPLPTLRCAPRSTDGPA